MAFILTPAYPHSSYNPSGFCSPAIHPMHRYRGMCSQPRRPQYSSFNHFFGQVDELLDEINHQAQRQAQLEAYRKIHNQQHLRKRVLRAQFAISQNEPGWLIDGDIQGFEQENLSIEVTNDHTLKIAGNTEWQLEKVLPENKTIISAKQASDNVQVDNTDKSSLTEVETMTIAPDSDTESHKSYQATVEDDFEDLGAETSSLISTASDSSTASESGEPKDKGKLPEDFNTQRSEIPLQAEKEEPKEQERHHGSFERTFRFAERIDIANVRASFKDGTLNITVPRAPAQEPKTVAIL